ncbi:MinD superfamily P-loop ATPase containing an inserted ferredoxin domain [Olavius algarvensis associated proteobacterium Delta 3]|nr:MinD superfamily P-loop ATPase containing an inserted ferredoxin domain [Olavius algarvensis associated proteobacterium Delta 3]
MIISIASGKGGTGKTTVAVNLAVSLNEKVQLLDCDVEEPNAHVFLHPGIDHRETVTVAVPEIDRSRCTLCGECSNLCQFKAIAVIPDTSILTFPEMCHSCGGCWTVCPENAISKGARDVGILESGHSNGVVFIHGRLRVGEAMAPPLIKQVRRKAEPGILTIIDAPPGTSCPVISSIRDTDVVLLVTEPTPFGLHDLKLAHAAVISLGIPAGLIVNRVGIGDDAVFGYAETADLPVLMEIPFDRRVAEAYAKGQLIVDAFPEYRKQFQALYRNVVDLAADHRAPAHLENRQVLSA